MADTSIPISVPGSKYIDIALAHDEIQVDAGHNAPFIPGGKKLSDIEYYMIVGGGDAWVAGNMLSSLSVTYGLRRTDEYWAQTGTRNSHTPLESAAVVGYLPTGLSSRNYYFVAIKWR